MKKLIGILSFFLFLNCVQKTYDRKVVYTLEIKGKDNIKSVGIRGNDKPLNWEQDFPMEAIKPNKLYQTTVTYKTGYKFTEVKFVVDNKFELKESPNRRIEFKNNGTTYYKATFNVE